MLHNDGPIATRRTGRRSTVASKIELTKQYMTFQSEQRVDELLEMLADDVTMSNPMTGTVQRWGCNVRSPEQWVILRFAHRTGESSGVRLHSRFGSQVARCFDEMQHVRVEQHDANTEGPGIRAVLRRITPRVSRYMDRRKLPQLDAVHTSRKALEMANARISD